MGNLGKLHNHSYSHKMKFAVVFILSAFGILVASAGSLELPQEIMDILKNASEICKAETGMPDSLISELRKAKLPDDPKVKCYIKCMMMQLQAMKEDGTLDTELIEASMPDVLKSHGGMETVDKCKHIHDPDLCETAFQLIACFKKENPGLANLFE